MAIIGEGGISHKAAEGEKVKIIVDKTPFYAESGGQVDDNGFMTTDEFNGKVLKVEKADGVFYHTVEVVSGALTTGETVKLSVNPIKRNRTMRNHTATHLLQKALREVLGTHVQQAGSMVNENILRFDFSHFEAVTKEQLAEIEEIVNEKINLFIPVKTEEMAIEDAHKAGAMALFGEKYGNVVRVVSAGGWSVELCGGTHVKNTGEIGVFKIISEGGVASGVRRIEAVTGTGVLAEALKAEKLVDETCEALKCNKNALAEKARNTSEELKTVKKELEEIKKAAMGGEADEMVKNAKEMGGVKLITKEFADCSINDLRSLSDDIKAAHKGVVMVFAAVNGEKVTFLVSITDDLVEKGLHAGSMVKQIAAAAGGGGGGKADMAQAGAKDPGKINDAFAVAEELLK